MNNNNNNNNNNIIDYEKNYRTIGVCLVYEDPINHNQRLFSIAGCEDDYYNSILNPSGITVTDEDECPCCGDTYHRPTNDNEPLKAYAKLPVMTKCGHMQCLQCTDNWYHNTKVNTSAAEEVIGDGGEDWYHCYDKPGYYTCMMCRKPFTEGILINIRAPPVMGNVTEYINTIQELLGEIDTLKRSFMYNLVEHYKDQIDMQKNTIRINQNALDRQLAKNKGLSKQLEEKDRTITKLLTKLGDSKSIKKTPQTARMNTSKRVVKQPAKRTREYQEEPIANKRVITDDDFIYIGDSEDSDYDDIDC